MFMRAVHPGEDELDITPTEFARQINVFPNRISQIIAGKRAVTGDAALRFGHWFGTEAQFWLNLQSAYEIRIAEEKIGREIAGPAIAPASMASMKPALQKQRLLALSLIAVSIFITAAIAKLVAVNLT